MINEIIKLGEVYENADLKKYTTYKVGGKADYLVLPYDIEALVKLLKYLDHNNIKHKVIGNGSNLIFLGDYNGVLIKLDKLNNIEINDEYIKAGAGASLICLALKCSKLGLTGMEFATGIPGTVGGAVYMNAGAYNESMSDIIESVKVLDDNYNIKELTNHDLMFNYRDSLLQHKKYICLEANIKLNKGDIDSILELIEKRKQKRIETQPLEYPSAGSVFRNPEGESAWKLVEGIGYKGKSIGGAKVSEKHANFIINAGNADGKDIKELIDEIKKEVKIKYNIDLKAEQEFVE